VELLVQVHRRDGYPRYLGRGPRDFLLARHETGAWVCELDGRVVGHVALHRAGDDPVLEVARQATGLAADELAVVARLFVSPGHRRLGIGRALLDVAAEQARAGGRRAVLDVADDVAGAPAAALYAGAGWSPAGATTFRFRSGATLDVRVWLSPMTGPTAHGRLPGVAADIQRSNPVGLHEPPGYHHVTVVQAGPTAYLAGQCPLDGDGNLVGPGDVDAQVDAVVRNALTALAAVDAAPERVVRSVIYVASSDTDVLGRVWHRLRVSPLAPAFTTAATLVGVSALGFTGQLVEIDLTAALGAATS
jgi:enamine deaminase RidA (YjgF/YER057c/UK114 family)/GNAT superfamily N-acetyltransferase